MFIIVMQGLDKKTQQLLRNSLLWKDWDPTGDICRHFKAVEQRNSFNTCYFFYSVDMTEEELEVSPA